MLQVLNQKEKKKICSQNSICKHISFFFLIALSKTNFEVIKQFLQYQERFYLFFSYKNKRVMSSRYKKQNFRNSKLQKLGDLRSMKIQVHSPFRKEPKSCIFQWVF